MRAVYPQQAQRVRAGLARTFQITTLAPHLAVQRQVELALFEREGLTGRAWRSIDGYPALAAEVDFLVLITPGGAATRHLIDAEVLGALGKGRGEGILVNVARGSVVDEEALIDALERGVIAAAGLDVFANEPQVPERLRSLPQVVLAPHIGSGTAATRQAMADLAFANLAAHFGGRPLPTPVPECR